MENKAVTDSDDEAAERREFLKRAGKFAVTAPAVTLLLSANSKPASAKMYTVTPPPWICLLEGSMIVMASGRRQRIETLELGDHVRCLDEETGRSTAATRVTRVIRQHPRETYYLINGELRITNDHPVLVANNRKLAWVRTDALSTGDRIWSPEGEVTVRTIVNLPVPAMTVYVETQTGNFVVAGEARNYVVSGNYAAKEALDRLGVRETQLAV
jgi:hypothetical protein